MFLVHAQTAVVSSHINVQQKTRQRQKHLKMTNQHHSQRLFFMFFASEMFTDLKKMRQSDLGSDMATRENSFDQYF